MMQSYKSNLPSNDTNRKKVTIVQTDLPTLVAYGKEGGNGLTYKIDLSKFLGEFAHNPNLGEEWIITQILSSWVLERRTAFQNNANTVLQSSNAGDTVFSNHAKLIFTDTQVQMDGLAIIGSGITRTVPKQYYNVTTSSVASATVFTIPNWAIDSTHSTSTGLFALNSSTGVFTALKAGTYSIMCTVNTASTLTTGRSFIGVDTSVDTIVRRSPFGLDNLGHMQTNVYVDIGGTFSINVFHTSAASRVITGHLEIIGLV